MNRFPRPSHIAAALLLGGALIAGIGLVFNPVYEPEAAAESEVIADPLNPVTGRAPIERIVTFWADRASASPSDYLNRTQHGQALLVAARESADLDTYAQAEAVFTSALERNERYEPAQLGLAQALHAQHRFIGALDVAEAVLRSTPDSWAARVLIADAQFELGNYDESVAAYNQLLGEQRSAPLLSRAALVASLAGDHEAAVLLAEEALFVGDTGAQRANTSAFFQFQIAHFRAEAGDRVEALELLDAALAIDNEHVGAVELSALLLADAGDFEAAAQRYEHVLTLTPAADLYGSYAEVLLALGEVEAAAANDALALELAYQTIEAQPAERRHVAEFFLTREPAVALELAELDLTERQDVAGWELLADAHEAAGNATAADEAQAVADELRATIAAARTSS